MFASLLRPKKRRGPIDQSPFSSPFNNIHNPPWDRSAAQHGFRHARRVSDSSDGHTPERQEAHEDMEEDWVEEDEDEEDGDALESTPLLPIFSTSHLGMALPPIAYCVSR